MLEVSGIRLPVTALDGTEECELAACRKAAARKLHVGEAKIERLELRRRSIDARKRDKIQLTYTVRLSLAAGEREVAKRNAKCCRKVDDHDVYRLPTVEEGLFGERPIVVGAGCAGLFCALALASAGARPWLIERGDDADTRTNKVQAFDAGGELDPESNIQFGLGGAGTFSDGKLQTGTKSSAHRLILETLADAGASGRILYDAKPHVGSDLLPGVVATIAKRIEDLGGTVSFRHRMCGLTIADGRIRAITIAHDGREELVRTEHVVLACGHSARDVFELLKQAGVTLERKTFAMGVRIEHLQADIDRALYGRMAGHAALGAAPYKLATHLEGGRSAFSFCMCPGGTVVCAASEPGGVVTNGQSPSKRDGINANAGLLANVFPDDLPGDDVLAGIELQRACERTAFEAAGGGFWAPAQLVGDFLAHVPSSTSGKVSPTYARGVTWGEIDRCLPDYVVETLREALPRMDRSLRGFSTSEAVLTGVETRSSSPVRVTRDERGQSVSTKGLWPCGEGAGYAGGIMSAATDGLRCADALIAHQRGQR